MGLMSAVSVRRGEQHRSTHTTSAEQAVKASLYREGRTLPDKMGSPLANFTKRLVALRTGEQLRPDPAYLSRTQHRVQWDPSAACPVYERWIMEVIPGQAADLE